MASIQEILLMMLAPYQYWLLTLGLAIFKPFALVFDGTIRIESILHSLLRIWSLTILPKLHSGLVLRQQRLHQILIFNWVKMSFFTDGKGQARVVYEQATPDGLWHTLCRDNGLRIVTPASHVSLLDQPDFSNVPSTPLNYHREVGIASQKRRRRS